MTPELSKTEKTDLDNRTANEKKSFNGSPETDYNSKTVAITAERHDKILLTNIVTHLKSDRDIPSEFSVIQRQERYYGPELLLHSMIRGEDQNFLLTAPGPTKQLKLWAPQNSNGKRRSGWTAVAEVQAVLAAEQPPYEVCDHCGEEIRTIEHERMAVLGRCQRSGGQD